MNCLGHYSHPTLTGSSSLVFQMLCTALCCITCLMFRSTGSAVHPALTLCGEGVLPSHSLQQGSHKKTNNIYEDYMNLRIVGKGVMGRSTLKWLTRIEEYLRQLLGKDWGCREEVLQQGELEMFLMWEVLWGNIYDTTEAQDSHYCYPDFMNIMNTYNISKFHQKQLTEPHNSPDSQGTVHREAK